MKKEYKEVCTSREVYIAADGQEFLDASECFYHEVDIGKWTRKIINDRAYYLLNSLRDFNEFKRELESVLRYKLSNDISKSDSSVVTNVYDNCRMSVQTRPSKFPCYVKYELLPDSYYPTVEISTLIHTINGYASTLDDIHKKMKMYEAMMENARNALENISK